MTNQSTQDWNEVDNIIDDVEFRTEDAEEFKNLLDAKESKTEEGSIASMTSGQILKGIVVELTKDFVIVDVGLKSEGLIPTEEFTELDEIQLGSEIEVLLDQD